MYCEKAAIILLCCIWIGIHSISTTNPLNDWWKPKDIGSVALLDTSSYIDPYRTDASISLFRPFVYGYVSKTATTTTQSFEECMEKCIEDANCKAFEINMLHLPFRCRLSVKPCQHGSCTEFHSHPQWKHFVRYNFDTHISVKSTVSLDTINNIQYKERKISTGYAVSVLTNNITFDFIEIETEDASSDSILLDYVWFEYKLTASSNWLKCQRVQLPRIKSIFRVKNKCLQYDFKGSDKTECNVLKESWEYHPITPRTTKIRNINFDENKVPSLKTCSDNMVEDQNSKIRYSKLPSVHAVRLFSNAGKFEVKKIKPIKLQENYVVSPTIITEAGDSNFKLPHNTTTVSDDPRNTVADWYYNILKDGGHLWCRNALNSSSNVAASNVFHRMHHTCYYRGSTLSKKSNTRMSDDERIHYFNSEQCSFDINDIPNCAKAWVEIHERCQGWDYCESTLTKAINVEIYHKGGQGLSNMYNGKNVDFPIIAWKSGWNRAQTADSEMNWSIDYLTDILLVLHDCHPTFKDFSGCSKCSSPYYEAEYNADIKIQDLRIYQYDPKSQYCRPQPTIWESQPCKEDYFCPKGPNDDFKDHQYWTCRTNFHGKQKVATGTGTQPPEDVQQGFGCFIQ